MSSTRVRQLPFTVVFTVQKRLEAAGLSVQAAGDAATRIEESRAVQKELATVGKPDPVGIAYAVAHAANVLGGDIARTLANPASHVAIAGAVSAVATPKRGKRQGRDDFSFFLALLDVVNAQIRAKNPMA